MSEPGVSPLDPTRGRCPLDFREGPSALSTPRRVSCNGKVLLRGSRRATGAPRRRACGAGVSPMRRRPKGFAVALWKPSLSLRMEGMVNVTGDDVADFQPKQPLGCCEGVHKTIAKPSARIRRRGTLFAAAAASCRFRVAARPLRAVTPAKGKPKFQPTCMGIERAEGPSRGPGAEPLAGCQGSALTGSPEGSALWRRITL